MPCPFCGSKLTRSKIGYVYTQDGKKRVKMLRCPKCRKNFLFGVKDFVLTADSPDTE